MVRAFFTLRSVLQAPDELFESYSKSFPYHWFPRWPMRCQWKLFLGLQYEMSLTMSLGLMALSEAGLAI